MKKIIIIIITAIFFGLSVEAQITAEKALENAYKYSTNPAKKATYDKAWAMSGHLDEIRGSVDTRQDYRVRIQNVAELTKYWSEQGYEITLHNFSQEGKDLGGYLLNPNTELTCLLFSTGLYPVVKTDCTNAVGMTLKYVGGEKVEKEEECNPDSWSDAERILVKDQKGTLVRTVIYQKNECGKIDILDEIDHTQQATSPYSVSTVRVVGSVSGPQAPTNSGGDINAKKIKIRNSYGGSPRVGTYRPGFGFPRLSVGIGFSYRKTTTSVIDTRQPTVITGTGSSSGVNPNGTPTIGDSSGSGETGPETIVSDNGGNSGSGSSGGDANGSGTLGGPLP